MSEKQPVSYNYENKYLNYVEHVPPQGNEGSKGHIDAPVPSDSKGSLETGVYWARWYILTIVCLCNVLNNFVWGCWGPIAQSSKAVYGWTDSTVGTMINFSNAGNICFLFFAGYTINKKGIRVSMLICTGLVALGTGLKAATTENGLATYLVAAGQFLNGLSSSVTAIIPPVITEVWFPSNERNVATAIGLLSSSAGGSAAFLIGPFLVSQPPSSCLNSTRNSTNCGQAIGVITQQMRMLNLIQLIWGSVLFVLTVVYFPAKPVKPPSRTAHTLRLSFKVGLVQVMQRPRLMLIVALSAVPWAVLGTWLSMLDVNLNGAGISQKLSGWFGFAACTSSLVGGVLIGRLADILQRRTKAIAIVVSCLTVASAVWVTGMRNGFLPRSTVQFAVSISLVSIMGNVVGPLCFELGCEEAYPIPESIIGTLSGLLNNLTSVVFLLVNLDPNIGTAWMNWTLVGAFSACVPLLISYQGRYRRLNIDLQDDQDTEGSEHDPLIVQ